MIFNIFNLIYFSSSTNRLQCISEKIFGFLGFLAYLANAYRFLKKQFFIS
jgi:hypothetical protein